MNIHIIFDGGSAGDTPAEPDIPSQQQETPNDDTSAKVSILVLFEELEGHMNQVRALVDADADDVTVVTQLATIIALARQTGRMILERHVCACLRGTGQHANQEPEALMVELTRAIGRFMQSVN